MLNVIDEFTRECLAIRIDRRLNSAAVIDVLTDLFILRGVPGHVRSELPIVAPSVQARWATGRSSSPQPFGTGSTPWGRRRRSSNRAARGMEEDQKTVGGLFSRQRAIARA